MVGTTKYDDFSVSSFFFPFDFDVENERITNLTVPWAWEFLFSDDDFRKRSASRPGILRHQRIYELKIFCLRSFSLSAIYSRSP